MNLKSTSVQKVALLALTFGATTAFVQPNFAQGNENSNRTFLCGAYQNSYATFVHNRQVGQYIPFISWSSAYFRSGGHDPVSRCRTVSDKFESEYKKDRLNYITSGRMGRQTVICTSARKGGECQEVLFTLKPGDDADRVLSQIFDIRTLGSNRPVEQSSYLTRESANGETRFYVDVSSFIRALDRNRIRR